MSFQSAEQAVYQAVSAIFQRWTALILTVEHQLGGDPKPIQRMLETTVSLATCSSPRYNARQIANYFDEEFDRMQTDVDDGSPLEVATTIINIRNAAAQGDYGPALKLVQQNQQSSSSNAAAQSVRGIDQEIAPQDDGNAQGEDADDSMQDEPDAPKHHQPMVDENGFMEVSKGGRHR